MLFHISIYFLEMIRDEPMSRSFSKNRSSFSLVTKTRESQNELNRKQEVKDLPNHLSQQEKQLVLFQEIMEKSLSSKVIQKRSKYFFSNFMFHFSPESVVSSPKLPGLDHHWTGASRIGDPLQSLMGRL